jgi:hypothetical protein
VKNGSVKLNSILRKMNASICLRKMGFISSRRGSWKQFMLLATIDANAMVDGQWVYMIKFVIVWRSTSISLKWNKLFLIMENVVFLVSMNVNCKLEWPWL